MAKINSLKQLIIELDKCQSTDINGFETILENFNLSEDKITQIEKICLWSKEFYTRNLIKRNDKYELIFLCWQPEQISPIHDHSNQSCWLKILQGDCREKLYSYDEKQEKLELIKTSRFRANEQSYIHDNIALHSVENAGFSKMLGLHLYLNPIDTCYVFDPKSGAKKIVQAKYNATFIPPSEDF